MAKNKKNTSARLKKSAKKVLKNKKSVSKSVKANKKTKKGVKKKSAVKKDLKEKLSAKKNLMNLSEKYQKIKKGETRINNDEVKKEENSSLLNKIVNTSIAEKKESKLIIKKIADNNFNDGNENNKQEGTITDDAETTVKKTRRGRRKRREKTWEEKAKKLPTFEISQFPKLPVKNILITNAKPTDLQNPYQFLTDKYKVNITFRPFIKVEGLTAQEFRNQKVDVLEYSGIIFTSRMAIDHFFRIINEMRIVMPDTTKYFCLNEQVAYYMQKYMELRKRKIFWSRGTLDDFKNVLKKNIDGKFLLPASDTIKEKIIGILDEIKAKYTSVNLYKTVPENITDIKPEKYDMIVFFTPIAVEALAKYFPKFKQNKTRFAAYSIITANKLKELGYRVDIFAPTIEFPSMVNAIAHYLLHIGEK